MYDSLKVTRGGYRSNSSDPDGMKKMLESPDLAEAMKEAGVLAPPEIFSGEKL